MAFVLQVWSSTDERRGASHRHPHNSPPGSGSNTPRSPINKIMLKALRKYCIGCIQNAFLGASYTLAMLRASTRTVAAKKSWRTCSGSRNLLTLLFSEIMKSRHPLTSSFRTARWTATQPFTAYGKARKDLNAEAWLPTKYVDQPQARNLCLTI